MRPRPSMAETAILGLAAFRLTRLVVTDDFPPVLDLRRAIIAKAGKDSLVGGVLDCSWCAGLWVALLLVVASRSAAVRRLLVVPAVSGLVGLLSTLDSALGRLAEAERPEADDLEPFAGGWYPRDERYPLRRLP